MQALYSLVGRAIVVLPAIGTVLSLVEPAFAGKTIITPAPIIGGLPALAVMGGGYWLIRKLRERR
jgi:hypothetical protein